MAVDELGAFLLEEAEKQAAELYNYKGVLYQLIAKGVDGDVVFPRAGRRILGTCLEKPGRTAATRKTRRPKGCGCIQRPDRQPSGAMWTGLDCRTRQWCMKESR